MPFPFKAETILKEAVETMRNFGPSVIIQQVNAFLRDRHGHLANVSEPEFRRLHLELFGADGMGASPATELKPLHIPPAEDLAILNKRQQTAAILEEIGYCQIAEFEQEVARRGLPAITKQTFHFVRPLMFTPEGEKRPETLPTPKKSESGRKRDRPKKPAAPPPAPAPAPPAPRPAPPPRIEPKPSNAAAISRVADFIAWAGGVPQAIQLMKLVEQMEAVRV